MSSAPTFERWRQDFANIVENLVGRRLDYTQLYPAVVVKQNSDGTLQLLADSPTVRGTGHNNVRIRHGLPGVSVEVSAGARVRLGFENGQPSQPYAGLWDTDASFVTINLGLAANTEYVALANKVDSEILKILNLLAGNAQTLPAPPTVPPTWIPFAGDGGALLQTGAKTLVQASVAAEKVKAE